MKALLKIEWIKTWRSWPVFIMSIGMPVGFFLLYSGMEMSPDPESQKAFILSYMLTMTGFSMSSFGFFTFPYMLREDQTDHWLTYIEHSKISIQAYYLSKIFRVLMWMRKGILQLKERAISVIRYIIFWMRQRRGYIFPVHIYI